jgi:uncharacterized protein YidB (DUF937 family)
MGLLDGLIGNALGGMMGAGGSGSGQAQSPLLQIALQLLQQNGGVSGVLDKFRQGGYADQADSWQGTGQNMPLSGNALQEVLGSGAIGQIAGQLGMSHGDTAGGLAQMLPQLIDQFTPKGEIPDNQNDLVAQALSILTPTRTG